MPGLFASPASGLLCSWSGPGARSGAAALADDGPVRLFRGVGSHSRRTAQRSTIASLLKAPTQQHKVSAISILERCHKANLHCTCMPWARHILAVGAGFPACAVMAVV